jgi:DNA-binding transcriptional regulator YiaG
MGMSLKECLYETAKGFYDIGLMEKEDFESTEAFYLSSNLPYESVETDELSPEEIKQLRRRNFLSEADLAVYLRTTIPTIKNWESGKSYPNKSELILLNIIQKKGLKAICA